MSPSRKHTVAVITACVAFVIFGFSFMFSTRQAGIDGKAA